MLPLLPPPRATQAASSTRASSAEHVNARPDAEAQSSAKANAQETYVNTGLSFEANEGQTDEQVRFLARGGLYALSDDERGRLRFAVFRLRIAESSPGDSLTKKRGTAFGTQFAVLNLQPANERAADAD
jgi:hypothetical protein